MAEKPLRILLTGATSFIGQALLPALRADGHEVICCVRDAEAFFRAHPNLPPAHIWEVDFSQPVAPGAGPDGIDAAYYLMHSMCASIGAYAEQDRRLVRHFLDYLASTSCRQVIYLGGIAHAARLSRHLASRLEVEQLLHQGNIPCTALRAAVVVGAGGASFQILREICEKTPLLLAPRWIETRCQPIWLGDAIRYLAGVLLRPDCLGRSFDIGGTEVLSYKDMLTQLAQAMGRRLAVQVLPFHTPPLWSVGWSDFLRSAPLPLIVNLLESMEYEAVCRDDALEQLLRVQPLGYRAALRRVMG